MRERERERESMCVLKIFRVEINTVGNKIITTVQSQDNFKPSIMTKIKEPKRIKNKNKEQRKHMHKIFSS